MSFQTPYCLNQLILIFVLLPYKGDVKEHLRDLIYKKILIDSKLDRKNKLSHNIVKFNSNVIEFHQVIKDSIIIDKKESERIKLRHMSKLKNFIPNFIWDLVATEFYNPKKANFNFLP